MCLNYSLSFSRVGIFARGLQTKHYSQRCKKLQYLVEWPNGSKNSRFWVIKDGTIGWSYTCIYPCQGYHWISRSRLNMIYSLLISIQLYILLEFFNPSILTIHKIQVWCIEPCLCFVYLKHSYLWNKEKVSHNYTTNA